MLTRHAVGFMRRETAGVYEAARIGCKRQVDRHDVRLAQEIVGLAALDPGGARGILGESRTPRQHTHPERERDVGDVPADVPQAEDSHRLSVQHPCERRPPLPAAHRVVSGGNLAHDRDREPDRELRRSPRKAPGGLRDHDAALGGGGQVDVIRVIAGLRDDAHVGQLLEQCTRESRAFPIGEERIESTQRRGLAVWPREDADLGALAQPPHARRALVRLVDVVENRDAHGESFRQFAADAGRSGFLMLKFVVA